MEIPTQVNVLYSIDGQVEPQWVRFRDLNGEIETIKITLSKQRNMLPGNTVLIDCEGVYGARNMKFTLKHDGNTSRWTIILN